jgi:hypothetical protein
MSSNPNSGLTRLSPTGEPLFTLEDPFSGTDQRMSIEDMDTLPYNFNKGMVGIQTGANSPSSLISPNIPMQKTESSNSTIAQIMLLQQQAKQMNQFQKALATQKMQLSNGTVSDNRPQQVRHESHFLFIFY